MDCKTFLVQINHVIIKSAPVGIMDKLDYPPFFFLIINLIMSKWARQNVITLSLLFVCIFDNSKNLSTNLNQFCKKKRFLHSCTHGLARDCFWSWHRCKILSYGFITTKGFRLLIFESNDLSFLYPSFIMFYK